MNSNKKYSNNPLVSLMRQPKIYIKLPSGGEYWPPGSIRMPETGDLPVYSMTAHDDLRLKIPDALMNGQAMVDVIQNCIPNIKNAWMTPNIDLDILLIAIRIATYGERMKVPLNIPNVEQEYEVDLRYIMASLMDQISWEPRIQVSPTLIIYVKPITYRQVSESVTQGFETQRIIELANDSKMSEEEKLRTFRDKFDKLTSLTTGLIHNSVFKIDSDQTSTDNLQFIKEFLENADKDIFDAIKAHIETMRLRNTLKPLKITPTPEMIEAGVPDKELEIPLVFDASTFFV